MGRRHRRGLDEIASRDQMAVEGRHTKHPGSDDIERAPLHAVPLRDVAGQHAACVIEDAASDELIVVYIQREYGGSRDASSAADASDALPVRSGPEGDEIACACGVVERAA